MEISWDASIKQNNMTEMEMKGLLLKLADLGVTGVKVVYEGSGDSGAIEWIGYTTMVSCKTPNDVDDNIMAWDAPSLALLDAEVYALIEDFAHTKLLDNIEDWWNDEGGYGELSICVPSGEYIISNNVRVVHSENYLHDGNLINKSLE